MQVDGFGFLGGLVGFIMMVLIYVGVAYLFYWIIRKAVKAGILDAQKQGIAEAANKED